MNRLPTPVAAVLRNGVKALIYPSFEPLGSRPYVVTPNRFNMPYEDLEFVNPDGVKVKGYLMLQKKHVSSSKTAQDPVKESDASSPSSNVDDASVPTNFVEVTWEKNSLVLAYFTRRCVAML